MSPVAVLSGCLIILLAGCGGSPGDGAAGAGLVVEVVPFEVRGQVQEAGFVGQSFARSLAMNLDRSEGLSVRTGDVPVGTEAAETTKPTHRMTGTLFRDGGGVRAGLQVVEISSGDTAWQAELESDGGDLTRLISRLARETARGLEVPYPDLYEFIGNVTGRPGMLESDVGIRTMEAWRRYDIDQFLKESEELVDRFGDDPGAHVLNAWALAHAWSEAPTRETLSALRARLLELDHVDSSSPYDELLRAFIYRTSGNPSWARELYSRILERTDLASSARAWALRQRSYTYLKVGIKDAALADARRAVELDPAGAASLAALSKALESSGELAEAITVSRKSLDLEPNEWRFHQRLGVVYTRAERFEEAAESLNRACEIGGSQEGCANLAVVLQRSGNRTVARAAARHAGELPGSPWGLYNLACFWSIAGEKRRALDTLRQALEAGYADFLITTDPDLDPLRGESEFQEIVEAMEENLRSRQQVSESIFPWQA